MHRKQEFLKQYDERDNNKYKLFWNWKALTDSRWFACVIQMQGKVGLSPTFLLADMRKESYLETLLFPILLL